MNLEQWRPIAARIESLWKDEFDEGREAAYFEALARYPAALVQAAVIELGGRPGGPFLPSAPEIAAAIADQARIGLWPWAHDQIYRVAAEVLAGDEWTRRPEAVLPHGARVMLEDAHPIYGPILADVAQQFGLATIYRHGTHGGFRSHTFRLAWESLAPKPDTTRARLAAP